MIIFDLDHTLFQTNLLKQDIASVFIQHGESEVDFWKTFYDSYTSPFGGTNGYYSIDRHLLLGNYRSMVEKKRLKRQLIDVIHQRGSGYLFDDVLVTLQALRVGGHRLVLLSKGDEELQHLKVVVTGIESYFHTIHFVRKDKRPIFKKIISEQDATINVNDHHNELRWAKQIAPTVKNIYIQRSPDFDTDLDDVAIVIKRLSELREQV